ncbi:MAG: arginine ABC transporter permease [Alphaproteobacteria bacterium CG_4_10_14_0_8_um_filter_37_21]|nr:MAG: arginine ABC transporter permease [Alphaproteobacteria bacterium CG_4_10_14_0_8_um_filter_37_21]
MLQLDVIVNNLPFLLEGALVTIKLTLIALICGLPLGITFGLMQSSDSKILKGVATAYVSVFRGTPLLVQLMIIFNALPFWGLTLSAFESGALALALNSAAYTSQSIRAGIQSVDQGQYDAAKVLGLSYAQTMQFIILPQAIRNIFPALINEMINLLKETAVISVIGELELFRRGQVIASQTFLVIEPYLMVGICYYVMILILSNLAAYVEKRMKVNS